MKKDSGVGDERAFEDDPEKKYIDVMSRKYTGQDRYQGNQPGDERVIITVTPTHVNTIWSRI
jgi:hypothetical protein